MAKANRPVGDEQLCAAAKAGSEDAFATLAGRYIFHVRARAADYAGSIEFEDLVQEGTIGILNAVRMFDPAAGVRFSTFAYLCIDRSILSAVRRALRKKQIPKTALISMESGAVPERPEPDPEQLLIDRESVQALEDKLAARLARTELRVLQLYLRGSSYKQIAGQLGCPVKSVDNAMARVRRKLKHGPVA